MRWLVDIVQMSVQAGVLIAAITIVRAVTLYRLPKTSFLALWGIVVARLLIPFSLTSKWSIYNLFGGLLEHEEASAPAGEFVMVWSDPALVSPGTASGPAAATPVISPLTALWIGGMAVLAAVFAVLLVKNYRALRTAVPVEDHAVITKWREEYRLFRPLAIVRSDRVASPASIGILRPWIIFPQKMDLDNEQLTRYILVHEYFHIRRFDMLWKLLALCAVCIHWFNPLVWVMLALLNRDLELSCDEMVLRHFGGTERASYAHSLIDIAERGRSFSFMHSYFSKNAAEERIIAIMKYKKTSLLAVVLALALIVGVTTAFATSASENEDAGTFTSAPEIEYPINDNGQTYGSAALARNYDERPDLIAAIGCDGQEGYIYKTDLESGIPKTPAEALAQQQQYEAMAIASEGERVVVRSIPLYDADGKTVIGKYEISFKNVNQ